MLPMHRVASVALGICLWLVPGWAAGQQRAATPPARSGAPAKLPADLANAVVVPAPHMTLRLGSDVSAVAPGGHATLVVEITPADKVHIYAPGQETYLPILIDLKSPSPLVTIAPTNFPPPATYVFEPTQEHFKVYSSRVRLTRVVTVADAPGLHTEAAKTKPFKLTGTLRYQACDDRVCFQPNSVAIAWTIGVK